MTRRLRWTCTLALLASGCGSRQAPPAPVRHPDVLLVSIDTLRADRATPELMPSLTAVAARGVRFDAARTVAPLTLPAHTSLMTGRYPPRTGVRLNGVQGLAPDVPTLAQAFTGAGYDTAAFVGAFVLDRRFGLSQGFAEYDDRIARQPGASQRLEAERRGSEVADRAARWIAQPERSPDRPLFVWVHFYDPHAPYDPPEAARARAHGDAYGGEVSFADEQLGRVIAAFTSAGRRDPLIVVVGDHGESLGEHGEPGHGMLLYEGAVRIPLVIAGPGVPHADRHEPVSLVDIAPTMLARAGLSAWTSIDGRDLLSADGADSAREVYAETEYPRSAGWSPLSMLANARWKLVEAKSPELYDLAADPREAADRSADNARDVTTMRQRLAALRSSPPASSPSAAVPDEVARKLRALGYVAPAPSLPIPENAPNPAAMMVEWAAFESALDKQARGDRDALPVFARMARAHPESMLLVTTWARSLAAAGRHREALTVYREAATRWPRDSSLQHDLGVSAKEVGQTAEALAAERKSLEIDPGNPLALNGLGLLLAESGDDAGARSSFEKAAASDPTNAEYQVNIGNAAQQSGDRAAAERAYRAALALDPASADGMNGLAVVLVQSGRAHEAVPILERVVEIDPAFVDGRLNLGIARQESGDLEGARAAYRDVLNAPARFARQRAAARQLLSSLR
jgi:arylsulfatase A-like enzyme/Flp pilus assembly protein TadD